MADDETIVSGYDAGNVSLGKPGVNGVMYRAPYGTALPTNASDPLPAVWKSVGYISEDGITNSVDTDNTTINDMGGTAVLTAISSYAETYQFTMIETNAESLKARYGDDNVIVDATGKPVSVNHKVDDGKASSWVKEIVMTGGVIKRTVIPNSTRSEFGDLVDVGTDAIGYDLTLGANPDKRIDNSTSRDYFARTATTPQDVPVDTVTVDNPTVNGVAGSEETVTVTITPDNATDTTVTVASDHPDIADATANGNLVTVSLKQAGTALLTITVGGKTVTVQVTVTTATVPVTGVTLDPTELTVDKGRTAKITATLEPEDATDTEIEWTSDHEDIATVDAGTVTGVAAGEATITATTHDGDHTATATVTVNPVLDALTVTATARIGGQTVTVTPAIADGLQRRYHVDAKAPTIAYDQVVATDDGWKPLPDDGQINETAGQTITIVDNTVEGAKARTIGTAVLPAPQVAVYYGVSAAATDAIDEAAVKALTAKPVTDTAAGTYDVNAAGDNDYILFALPADMKAPTFAAGGFAGGFAKAKTVGVDGVDYDVWRSDNSGLGEITVTVK